MKTISRRFLPLKNRPFAVEEAFVRLRTNFIYTTLNGQYKKIIITSCEPGEGKSTVALHLAESLAKYEKKVLLLDCDMRRSFMRKYISLKNDHKHGLSAILSNQIDYRQCIETVKEYGFDVIHYGARVPNPAELLGSKAMEKLLEALSREYDYILMDAPPILSVSDAAILCEHADGVLFVVKHGAVKKKQVMAAMHSLQAVGARIIGLVLDQYDMKKDHSAYGYGGYYYRSSYYGSGQAENGGR